VKEARDGRKGKETTRRGAEREGESRGGG